MSQPRRRGTVQIVERLAPGGIETMVLDLVRSAPENHAILSLQGTVEQLVRDWEALRPLREQIVAFGRNGGLQPSLVLALRRRLRDLRPDTVIVHHIGPLLYGGLAARLAGVPHVIHVEHDAWHYDSARRRRVARWCALVLRPRVVAVSRQVAERVQAVMPGAAITVIPPGVPVERFRPGDREQARRRLALDPAGQVVGTVGRLVPVKGQRFLLEALRDLPATVHAMIVGGGPERDNLQRMAQALGVAERTHFLGHRDDLCEVYPAFDVFCLPSLAEGLPRTVLEAQACGVPVVASDVGGLPEAVCGRTGVLVPAGEPAAIAAAIRRLLDRGTAAASPRPFVERHLSWARTLQGYRELAEQR
jgi:glycosyltransferase involved in cell wall biosynthesis